jgi:hypothetical protein
VTDAQLTTLATLAWLVGTVTLFILLAHWSAGGSWGISAAVARGIIGWAGRNGSFAGEWSSTDELPPIQLPERSPTPSRAVRAPFRDEATAELEDLGTRRLP